MAQFTLSYKLQTDFSKSVTGIGLSAVYQVTGEKNKTKTLSQCNEHHKIYLYTVTMSSCV